MSDTEKKLDHTDAGPLPKRRMTRKKLITVAALSFLAGMFWLSAVRFIAYDPQDVHYHADFALFVDGERYPFDRFSFYEEVTACGGDGLLDPATRAHMHDEINYIVHVHDDAATWGHFFANIGMTAGDTVFKVDTDVYVEQEGVELHYILNDKPVRTIANRVIESEDTLLISIGTPTDSQLADQYAQIQQDAGTYNAQDDPAACSGSGDVSFTDRLKQAIFGG